MSADIIDFSQILETKKVGRGAQAIIDFSRGIINDNILVLGELWGKVKREDNPGMLYVEQYKKFRNSITNIFKTLTYENISHLDTEDRKILVDSFNKAMDDLQGELGRFRLSDIVHNTWLIYRHESMIGVSLSNGSFDEYGFIDDMNTECKSEEDIRKFFLEKMYVHTMIYLNVLKKYKQIKDVRILSHQKSGLKVFHGEVSIFDATLPTFSTDNSWEYMMKNMTKEEILASTKEVKKFESIFDLSSEGLPKIYFEE